MFGLAGRTVFVTGASSGLGAHFARVVANAGASGVVLAARRTDRLEKLKHELEEGGTAVLTTALDVTKQSSIKAAFELAEERFGVCNVLINNAGVADSAVALRTSESSWNKVLDTNLKGAFFVAKEAAVRMRKNKQHGSIINVCSILGERPAVGQASYGASKAGLIHITKTLAIELARNNIRVNALCPGYFETEMNSDYVATDKGRKYISRTPAGRVGQLRELSGPLLLLASDAGSFMSGAIIAVDGGHLCSSL